MTPSIHCLVTIFSLLMTSVVRGEDWPQFRGPNCSGVSASQDPLPFEFYDTEDGEQKNVLWSVPLGDGVGSPAVAAGRVFTAGMIDKQTVGLFAFDATTGKPLWQRQWPTGPLAEISQVNSYASSTPAADDQRVYFYFATLGMLCVDAASGEDVWQKQLPTPFFVFKWGPGMSPVLHKELLLFCQDDDLNPALYAIDKRTGQIRWQDDRLDMAVNYSHPVICTTDAGDEIVVAGTGLLIGFDPASGRRKWWARVLLRNIKSTPVVLDGVVYVTVVSQGIAYQWLAVADTSATGNRDGKVSKEEIQAAVGDVQVPDQFFKRTFERGDLNRDGVLEGEELDAAFLHPDNFAGARFDAADPSERFLLAVRGGGEGDVTGTHVMWRQQPKNMDSIPSPLVVNNRLWLIRDGSIASCHEIDHGELVWGPKRVGDASKYYASPVCGDGKIFLAGENGQVVVISDREQPEVLATNNLGNDILGTPAISDGRLFLRARKKLVCIADLGK